MKRFKLGVEDVKDLNTWRGICAKKSTLLLLLLLCRVPTYPGICVMNYVRLDQKQLSSSSSTAQFLCHSVAGDGGTVVTRKQGHKPPQRHLAK